MDILDGHGYPYGHNTYFRFMVKQLVHEKSATKVEYEWYEMSFFIHCESQDRTLVLCLDTPSSLQGRLRDLMSSPRLQSELLDIHYLHTLLVDEVIHLYDNSVWTLRDIVRDVETNRELINRGSRPEEINFSLFHDIARHAIHCTETLDVAVNTMKNMESHYEAIRKSSPSQEADLERRFFTIQRRLQFQMQLLQNLRTRSSSIDARLRNEISLAFNLVAQRDSRINLRIGEAAIADSAAMKTISLVTMILLPATFVSTIFSMSFFNFTPAAHQANQHTWIVSKKIWIYWVVTIPLTLATVGLWFIRERRSTGALGRIPTGRSGGGNNMMLDNMRTGQLG